MIDILLNNIKDYTDNFSVLGIARAIIDLLLVVVALIIVFVLLSKKIKKGKFYFQIILILIFYLLSVLFSLDVFNSVLKYLIIISGIVLITVYAPELRHDFENRYTISKTNSAFNSEEEKHEIIDVLCDSCEYLARRKIGALITIEKNDNLNSFIEKAIPINSNINQEILTTIFYPGTACHDGAVIIRTNKIMCAGAYLPSTDKYDIPKNLGTRHRAAIGLSERYDALTIVVSEETGNISVALSGVIRLDLKRDGLKEALESFLGVE